MFVTGGEDRIGLDSELQKEISIIWPYLPQKTLDLLVPINKGLARWLCWENSMWNSERLILTVVRVFLQIQTWRLGRSTPPWWSWITSNKAKLKNCGSSLKLRSALQPTPPQYIPFSFEWEKGKLLPSFSKSCASVWDWSCGCCNTYLCHKRETDLLLVMLKRFNFHLHLILL